MLFKTLFLNTEKVGYTKAEKWLCYTLHSIGLVPVFVLCTEASAKCIRNTIYTLRISVIHEIKLEGYNLHVQIN